MTVVVIYNDNRISAFNDVTDIKYIDEHVILFRNNEVLKKWSMSAPLIKTISIVDFEECNKQ